MRAAEIKVYKAFKSLDNEYRIFYSTSWQQKRIYHAAEDGEADFVLAHPKMGVIVFEVKGGGIVFNANKGEWSSRDRNGNVHLIKDPVKQASKSKSALLEKLKSLPGWDNNRFLNMGHAVIFPDIFVTENYLKQDLPKEIIVDHQDLENLNKVIPTIMSYYSSGDLKTGNLGNDRLERLEKLLARSFNITTPMGVEFDYLEEKLIHLTEDQMNILDHLGSVRKAKIKGCAGSGKTMLAVEKARRLSEEGFNVLLVCFNFALANYLVQKAPNICVKRILELFEDLVKEAGIKPRNAKDIHDYYDNVLPEAGFDAAVALGKKYDAIIVDEGQDFRELYWLVINEVLSKPNGILYVFYDDNQNLFKSLSIDSIIEGDPFLLTENCRNTKLIHELVRNYHQEKEIIKSKSPDGFKPEIYYYENEAQLKNNLQSLLNKLINQEKIDNRDIVILSPHSQENTLIKNGAKLGNFLVTENPVQKNNEIFWTSIYKFKGLESKVILLIDISPSIINKLNEFMYVGCSRAKSYLALMVDKNLFADLKSEIESVSDVIRN